MPAIGYSAESGIPHNDGLIKNRYIGRTFIEPSQAIRDFGVKLKLNPVRELLAGKRVVLVDDSIVRGTTCRQIIEMARDAGAENVYFASAAPPVRYPNVYGIDMPSASELIAHNRSVEQVCELIGADWLVYQDLDDLVASSAEGNPAIERFETNEQLQRHLRRGMLRTGVEDTFYLPNGDKTTGNGQLIEALAQCARNAGREVASPAEAREMLGFN